MKDADVKHVSAEDHARQWLSTNTRVEKWDTEIVIALLAWYHADASHEQRQIMDGMEKGWQAMKRERDYALAEWKKVAKIADASRPLVEAARRALEQLPNYKAEDWPPSSHAGSCGPEAGCDATCMDRAYISETMRVRAALAQALREHEEEKK